MRYKTSHVSFILLLFIYLAPVSFSQNYFGTPSYNSHVQNIVNAISEDSLQKYIKELSGEIPVAPKGIPDTLYHRKSSTSKFRTAADYIFKQFNNYGLNPLCENNSSPWDRINVIGTLQGLKNEYVIISGHFDSACPTCPGADDNASGTSAVIEAARILKGYKFEYTIKFIAFGGEEQGLLGSKDYVSKHTGDSIRAVINSDMLMWDGDADLVLKIHTIANDTVQHSDDVAQYVTKVDSVYALPLHCSKVLPGITASDHSPFWTGKKSAVLLIEEYGSDFNPYYHSINDSWAKLSDPQHQIFFFNSSRLAIAATAHLSGIIQPTPVELASFEATQIGSQVRLYWLTTTETNNYGFEIERRIQNNDWMKIGFVTGNSTSNSTHEYSFIDYNIEIGETYLYRLKQIDIDGSINYSPPVEIFNPPLAQTAMLFQNYPNPVSASSNGNSLTIISFWMHDQKNISLEVFDVFGRRTSTLYSGMISSGIHKFDYPTHRLLPGIYFYRLYANGHVIGTRSMIVTK